MQRAQRAADSPLRAILEAAKVKRRVDPEVMDIEGAAGGTRRALPQRPPAVAAGESATRGIAAAPVAAAPLAPPLPFVSSAPSAPSAPSASAATAAPAGIGPPPGLTTIRTLPGEVPRLAGKADTTRASLAAVGRLEAPAMQVELPRIQALPAPRAPADVAAAASARAGEPPRLLHMVEPEVPIRVLESLTHREVMVEFIIGIDGGVSDVRVLPPAPRQIASPVAAALEQWRYEPQREPRPNRVVLVFNAVR